MPLGEKTKKLLENPKYRKHMSDAHKGNVFPYMSLLGKSHKGKKLSNKHKKHISEARMGKKLSDYHKDGLKRGWLSRKEKGLGNAWNKGKKLSKKHKEKLSQSHKGKPTWNKGKKGLYKSSEETRKKISIANKGKKSHLWKGGLTLINKIIRESLESRLWREAVFARDGWTCQKCLVKGGNLHPHHIRNFAQYPGLRFAIDNGITFCRDCHKLFHKIYGKKDNNVKQVNEFLSEERRYTHHITFKTRD